MHVRTSQLWTVDCPPCIVVVIILIATCLHARSASKLVPGKVRQPPLLIESRHCGGHVAQICNPPQSGLEPQALLQSLESSCTIRRRHAVTEALSSIGYPLSHCVWLWKSVLSAPASSSMACLPNLLSHLNGRPHGANDGGPLPVPPGPISSISRPQPRPSLC